MGVDVKKRSATVASSAHTAALTAALSLGLALGLAGCAPEASSQPAAAPTASPTPTTHPGVGPKCPTDNCFTLVATGDMLFHAGLWKPAALNPPVNGANFDFGPLLEGQSRYLNASDIAMCHMETPYAPKGGPYTGYPLFATPPELATTIKAVGYDACTTASNHTIDQGHAGVVRTLDVLDAAGLSHTGSYRTEAEAQNILIMKTDAGKVAFIESTFSNNGNWNEFDWQVDYPLAPEKAIAKAKKARELGADVVIGVQHAGTEYSNTADVQQVNNAHLLIDSGQFDMVYGHHPHAVQPIEFYQGKPIAYSLGNGISESSSEYPTNNAFMMMRVQFAKDAAGKWSVSDLAWAPATNKKASAYKWCSVASDSPMGICQSVTFDANVRETMRKIVNAMGADKHGVHEWLVTEDKPLP